MKVEIKMSNTEKIIAGVILLLLIIFLYFYNRRYLFITDVEFEDGIAKKLYLKTGFVFPVITEIILGKEASEVKVKSYGYIVKANPVIENKKASGEYSIEILKNKSDKLPYKKVTIKKDDYYIEMGKTPLGKL